MTTFTAFPFIKTVDVTDEQHCIEFQVFLEVAKSDEAFPTRHLIGQGYMTRHGINEGKVLAEVFLAEAWLGEDTVGQFAEVGWEVSLSEIMTEVKKHLEGYLANRFRIPEGFLTGLAAGSWVTRDKLDNLLDHLTEGLAILNE